MKRVLLFLAAISISLGLSTVHAQKVERITMVGGPPSGVFGIFATGIGTYLSKNVPGLDVSVTATGGSVENPRRPRMDGLELAEAIKKRDPSRPVILITAYAATVQRGANDVVSNVD